MTKNSNYGHAGLTYLYNYTGEIHVENSNLRDVDKGDFKVSIVQSLFPTHFVDKYEMERDFPHIVV